jgi:hypothetical protein
MSDNMNGKRPVSDVKHKDVCDGSTEKLKELAEKNERLEKDLLKMNIQVKTLEDKLKSKSEREYVVYIFIYYLDQNRYIE